MHVRSFCTPDFHGFNLRFCPFRPNRLACSAGQNYGIFGPGSLFIVDDVLSPSSSNVLSIRFNWKDSLYDVVWSEAHQDILVTASGDSTLQTWNLQNSSQPTSVLSGHSKEVSSLDWNQTRTNQLLVSGSWDGSAKIWDCDMGKCLSTFSQNDEKIYCVVWSPLIPHVFAAASGDGCLHLWNVQKPSQTVLTIPTSTKDVLSCAWNFYDKDIIMTVGTDNYVKGWDLRQPKLPVFQLSGHTHPVKQAKFSPHMRSILATVSCDFTTRIWDFNSDTHIQCFQHHTEFVCGLDFNSNITGLIADCGWDQTIQLFAWPCLTTQDKTTK